MLGLLGTALLVLCPSKDLSLELPKGNVALEYAMPYLHWMVVSGGGLLNTSAANFLLEKPPLTTFYAKTQTACSSPQLAKPGNWTAPVSRRQPM